MATESNANEIDDFDIDQVIDWDQHDIPTKDIEFDQLQGLEVQVSNVGSSTSQASSTNSLNNSGRDGLVMGSQLLAPHREAGAAIASLPQVPQSSAINPVFPGDPNSLIRDIQQEYLQNLAARSRTPPTPTFPSENFDLPPITPPGSMQGHSTFPVGQQRVRMPIMSNLNRPTTVHSQLSPFVPPNLPSVMSQQLSSEVSSPMVEGPNIDELIDEIVERDMPQGVSEPIVFATHVSQQPSPPTTHSLFAANALQKGLTATSVQAASSGQLAAAPSNVTCKTQLPMTGVTGGSPLNAAGSPGSPLASSRSPSPKVKQANHAGKVSAPIRAANQGMRHAQSIIQPGSPRQTTAPLSIVNSTRSFVSTNSQLLSTTSQRLQMAVPSAVAASSKAQGGSCQPRTASSLKKSMESANPHGQKVTLSAPVTQSSSQFQTQIITAAASNKMPSQNVAQGPNISATRLQSSNKPIQAIPLSNPELLGQLVKAMGQPNAKQQGTTPNIHTGQPLICYVVPQSSASGVQSSQAKSSSQPVKMILVNPNSPLKPSVSLKPQLPQTVNTNPSSASLNCKASVVSSSSQLAQTTYKTALETAVLGPAFKELPLLAETGNMTLTEVKSGSIVDGNNSTRSVQLNTTVDNNQVITSVPGQQQPFERIFATNSNTKQISTALGSTQSNSVPLLQTPLSSGNNVVQITFVNEATAISQVVAASPAATVTASSSGGSLQGMVTASQSLTVAPGLQSSSHTPLVRPSLEPTASTHQQDSDDDDDDDDSTPLSQVAENLKKVGGDEVKKKKKKKKDKEKGSKRKRKGKEKDTQGGNKPLTAYELFFKETQAAVRTKNPQAQFEDIKKIVDQMWDTLNENHKKAYQEKAQQLENQFQAKRLIQQDEPTLKLKKVEVAAVDHVTSLPESSTAAATPGSLKVISDMVAVTNSKPLSRTTTQVAMAGKPVATVPPMAAAKTTITTNTQPNISAKPKKSKVTVNPISQRICLCDGCNKPARTTKERGTQYCSNECIVKHCRMAFTLWVTQRNEISEANG